MRTFARWESHAYGAPVAQNPTKHSTPSTTSAAAPLTDAAQKAHTANPTSTTRSTHKSARFRFGNFCVKSPKYHSRGRSV